MGISKEREKQMEQKIIKNVNKYGWQVQMVVDPDGKDTTFAYTIGLHKTLENAEIICFGLHPEVMHRLLNAVGNMIKEGEEVVEDRNYDQFLQDYPIRFKKVRPSHFPDFVGWAMWFNDYQPFDVLQVFWTDKDGNYPWEDGFDPKYKEIQPFLFMEKGKQQ